MRDYYRAIDVIEYKCNLLIKILKNWGGEYNNEVFNNGVFV